MSFEDLKNQTFPSITKNDWKLKAEESLKGKTVDSLQTTTYEAITLQALYTRLDEQKISDYPGGSDFRRGIYPLGYQTSNWKVAQRISSKSFAELKGKLQEAIEKGQTAISFEVSKQLFNGKETLREILGELTEIYPFAINTKGMQSALIAELTEMAVQQGNGDKITGYVANDPISMFAEEGQMSNEVLAVWSEDIKLANNKLPNLQTVLINTAVYHQGGANAVQELELQLLQVSIIYKGSWRMECALMKLYRKWFSNSQSAVISLWSWLSFGRPVFFGIRSLGYMVLNHRLEACT